MAKHLVAGQPLSAILGIPARDWNAALDAGAAHSNTKTGSGTVPTGNRDADVVLVRNDTGAALDRGSIVGIGPALISHADNAVEYYNRLAFEGDTPDEDIHTGNFAVLIDHLAPAAVGFATAAGLARCIVNITNASHQYAELTNASSAYLTSALQGSARILERESGTGQKKATVRLGVGPPPAAWLRLDSLAGSVWTCDTLDPDGDWNTSQQVSAEDLRDPSVAAEDNIVIAAKLGGSWYFNSGDGVVIPKKVSTGHALALGVWSCAVLACDDWTGANPGVDTETCVLPHTSSATPNVKAGDIIGVLPDGTGGHTFVAVTGYLDDMIGTVKAWKGDVGALPHGWEICAEGKAIVGYYSSDPDYSTIGNTGGFKEHGAGTNTHTDHTTHATHATHVDHVHDVNVDNHTHDITSAVCPDAVVVGGGGTVVTDVTTPSGGTAPKGGTDCPIVAGSGSPGTPWVADHSAHSAHSAHSTSNNRMPYIAYAWIERTA